jgi:hypothetical protein
MTTAKKAGAPRRETDGAPSRHPLGDYGLSIVLTVLFLTSLVLQTWMGWRHFAADALAHHQRPTWFGDDGYVWSWGLSTFENWQSEFLQLLTFVVLTATFIHKGSHESKDEDEAVQRQLDRIEERLEALAKRDGQRSTP